MPNGNATKYWMSPIHTGVSLLHADLVEQDFPPHVHDTLVIAVTEAGGAMVRGRGARFMAAPGTTLVFNAGEPHSSTKSGMAHWAYRSFYLHGEALRLLRDTLQCSNDPYFEENGFADAELTTRFLDAHAALESEADLFLAEEKFAEAMGLLYSRYGQTRPLSPPGRSNKAIVERLLSQIRDRFSEPLHLGDLAEDVGLTQFQLIGLFKASLGMTPYSMLTQIRLARACGMLIGGMEICETALAAGFYDQSAFTKHFKRRFAVTPAQFVHARMS